MHGAHKKQHFAFLTTIWWWESNKIERFQCICRREYISEAVISMQPFSLNKLLVPKNKWFFFWYSISIWSKQWFFMTIDGGRMVFFHFQFYYVPINFTFMQMISESLDRFLFWLIVFKWIATFEWLVTPNGATLRKRFHEIIPKLFAQVKLFHHRLNDKCVSVPFSHWIPIFNPVTFCTTNIVYWSLVSGCPSCNRLHSIKEHLQWQPIDRSVSRKPQLTWMSTVPRERKSILKKEDIDHEKWDINVSKSNTLMKNLANKWNIWQKWQY